MVKKKPFPGLAIIGRAVAVNHEANWSTTTTAIGRADALEWPAVVSFRRPALGARAPLLGRSFTSHLWPFIALSFCTSHSTSNQNLRTWNGTMASPFFFFFFFISFQLVVVVDRVGEVLIAALLRSFQPLVSSNGYGQYLRHYRIALAFHSFHSVSPDRFIFSEESKPMSHAKPGRLPDFIRENHKVDPFFFKFCSHKFSTGETIKYFSFIDRYNIDTVITSIASKLTHSTGCTGFFFSGFCEVSPGFSSSVAGVIGLHLRCTNQSFSVVILFCSSRNTESTPRDRPQRPVMLQGAMGWGVRGLGSS